MYVTRPLSQLLKSAELVATPPDGPNSGILVIQDEEFVTYSCFGCCKNTSLKALPFPQDKELTLTYTRGSGHSTQVSLDPLFFIPVLNHPLEAFTCSRIDEDKATSCFCRCIKDEKPRPLDPNNIYQQFEIVPYDFLCSGGEGYFFARSVASDGFTPYFLGRMGWTIFSQTPKHFNLRPALGLDSRLRARLPRLGMVSVITVGRWYAPFIFVKEGTLRDQVERSMYYEVTLEQRWDRIYSCRRNDPGIMINSVVIDTALEKERVFVGGSKASWDERSAVDGVVWFDVDGGGGAGLRVELVQRMKWEEERGGWIGGGREDRDVRIHRVEEFQKKGGDWNEFGCYVLVETFNFRRMDGSLLMSYDFNHFHHLKTKWE
ncbi:hypothetical protein C2S53_010587 [Perilla frutescens var. hirtella]|uniref:Uncharacterized protein n=1 Tax=Perilla frutescens var. hirtella TaxID=608512 RepID=A0AAD4ITR9_PERFH|nr:hypothetical protein C2S53_010587 [Perilla frutescens var. hirtella]